MNKVFICAAKRSPIGSFGGSLASLSPRQLGAEVLKSTLTMALGKGSLVEGNTSALPVDEVIVGNVLAAGHGMNIARQVTLDAGLPVATPAFSINKVCGSGLKSVLLGAQAVALGDSEIVAAGGVESMSQAGFVNHEARFGKKMGSLQFVDLMLQDGLTDAFSCTHMGITAENLARKFSISREEQDRFAVHSQEKAVTAQKKGWLKSEIHPIPVPQRKGEAVLFSEDEFLRPETTVESLSRLRPAFEKDGTVTAGNSSGINDGAAFVLLASEAAIERYELKPLARIAAYASAGVAPEVMGLGPVEAVRKVLKRTEKNLEEIDLIESNEAFASQALAVNRELDWDVSKVNVAGGAIALGHPIGASGARILVTLLHQMQRVSATSGIATLCVGGGQGVAVLVERTPGRTAE
ncbi:MAG: acetyl-CoA C-acetyltransferase [Bdellovibrionales bacterium]|nr:acetyl-CoA C-acetyltransferase [Bdellovibrionales bacterium]